MQASIPIRLLLLLVFLLPGPARAEDQSVEVRVSQDVAGIEQIFRRCFTELRSAGHDGDRMPESEIAICMRPELEAMAEFAYEVSTAYAVSSLTRIALETCTLEQSNALAAPGQEAGGVASKRLSWRWLTDCLKEARWVDHDEQTERLRRARREAESARKSP